MTDGVTFAVEVDNSLRVVSEVLDAEGWGLTITPVWNRYWLYVPNQYQTLPLDELIGGSTQCATGNPVPVDFFRSGSGQISTGFD